MKNPQYLTDSSLQFVISDCNAAISAMPDNPKVRQYLDERDSCQAELNRRNGKRTLRRIRSFSFDPLYIRITHRRHYVLTTHIAKQLKDAHSATWSLAYDRLHPVNS